MTIINERDAQEIRQHLAASITRPVQLALFVSADSCEYCAITRELVAALRRQPLRRLASPAFQEAHSFVAQVARGADHRELRARGRLDERGRRGAANLLGRPAAPRARDAFAAELDIVVCHGPPPEAVPRREGRGLAPREGAPLRSGAPCLRRT